MQLDQSTILGATTLLLVIKFAILVLLFLYIVFSLVIVRQVKLMSQTLITPIAPIVKALAIFNAGFAIAFFVLALGSL